MEKKKRSPARPSGTRGKKPAPPRDTPPAGGKLSMGNVPLELPSDRQSLSSLEAMAEKSRLPPRSPNGRISEEVCTSSGATLARLPGVPSLAQRNQPWG